MAGDVTESRGRELLEYFTGLSLPAETLELREDEPMARHTTLRLGGHADLWCRPADSGALQAVLARAASKSIPVTFVGSGTNLLVRDGGIRGLVVNLSRMNRVERPEPEDAPGRVYVEAGASTGRLLARATQWTLGGVEFLAGVPGSVGGGLVMNAGTILGEFTDVVVEVRSMTRAGEPRVRDHDACGFRYRASDLPADEVVVSADLQLAARELGAIQEDVRALRERRKAREPSRVRNCGSTFKNPDGDYAGRLIELAGLKGTRRGAIVVSPDHANWLVVDPEPGSDTPASSRDYLELMAHVQEEVRRIHGVSLEPEVRVIGE
jgi:UDP-N-acetylmuramate dehydrogenase